MGAADTAGTPSTANDVVPAWSGREQFRGYSKPDVVAPGVSVVSLRAPGSTVDVTHPEGRVGDTYFRGTGTSMSTAMVSGSAALLLASHPAATPDDVKGALIDGAVRISGGARRGRPRARRRGRRPTGLVAALPGRVPRAGPRLRQRDAVDGVALDRVTVDGEPLDRNSLDRNPVDG